MRKRGESVPENMTLYFIKHVQLGSVVVVITKDFTYEQTVCKSDFDILTEGDLLQRP